MTSKTPLARLVARRRLDAVTGDTQGPDDIGAEFTDFAGDKTAAEALAQGEFDWMAEVPGRSYEECAAFLDSVAKMIVPSTRTALELFESSMWTSTSLSEVDEALQGGLKAGHLVEVVGRAGVGKSQLCMTIASRVISKGRGVIYLDSERKFSVDRLTEIYVNATLGKSDDLNQVRILRADEMTFEEFLQTLKTLESSLLEDNVGLIVVDSIAAIARGTGNTSKPLHERQSYLARIATELKYIAETFSIPVLVTNQVTGYSSDSVNQQGSVQKSTTAALGNTWHHVVNTRLLLNLDSMSGNRTLHVAKSPDTHEVCIEYSISTMGVTSMKRSQYAEDVVKDWAAFLQAVPEKELGI